MMHKLGDLEKLNVSFSCFTFNILYVALGTTADFEAWDYTAFSETQRRTHLAKLNFRQDRPMMIL